MLLSYAPISLKYFCYELDSLSPKCTNVEYAFAKGNSLSVKIFVKIRRENPGPHVRGPGRLEPSERVETRWKSSEEGLVVTDASIHIARVEDGWSPEVLELRRESRST